jgi:DNA-binding HxlR family transcriptional regulator
MSSSQPTDNSLHDAEGDSALAYAFLCPRYQKAVELIGRRWTGAIIRILLAGPRRFNELLAAVPGMSDRLLTERLRELEGQELIRREVRGGSPVRVVYSLTCAGAELKEALDALGRWAERWIEPKELTA